MTTFLNFGGGASGKIKKTKIATMNGNGTKTVDIKPHYSKWNTLTVNNFCVGEGLYTQAFRGGEVNTRSSFSIRDLAYNAATGILSYSAQYGSWGPQWTSMETFTTVVYMFTIESGGGN